MHRFSEAVSLHLISLDYLENDPDHEVLYAALIISKKNSVLTTKAISIVWQTLIRQNRNYKKKGRRHL